MKKLANKIVIAVVCILAILLCFTACKIDDNTQYNEEVDSFFIYFGGEKGGDVSGTVESGSEIIVGSTITLYAQPQYGYIFDGWYMDGELVSRDLE